MMSILEGWLQETPERAKLSAEEELILSAADAVWETMEAKNVSKTQIAQLLGLSKPQISKVLSGHHNMTLRTLACLAYALGKRVNISLNERSNTAWQPKSSIRNDLKVYTKPLPTEASIAFNSMQWQAANEQEFKHATEPAAA